MSSVLESLAAFVQDPELALQAGIRMDHLRLHIADTLAMILQGATLAEGKTALALGSRLAGWCACARLTEADDIHLTSCTTCGSRKIQGTLTGMAGYHRDPTIYTETCSDTALKSAGRGASGR